MIRPATEADLLPASQGKHYRLNQHGRKASLILSLQFALARFSMYPEDFHIYFLRRFRQKWAKPGNSFLVAVNESGEIQGLAHWCRFRASDGEEEPLVNDGSLPPNRAADPEKEDIIERSMSFAYHHWQGKAFGKRAESWYLSCLAIDPKFQGQGIGRPLVAWGFEQAKKEGVCVSVISALGKDGFYKRCGFDQHVGNACAGKENPLEGVEGGNVYFCDVVA